MSLHPEGHQYDAVSTRDSYSGLEHEETGRHSSSPRHTNPSRSGGAISPLSFTRSVDRIQRSPAISADQQSFMSSQTVPNEHAKVPESTITDAQEPKATSPAKPTVGWQTTGLLIGFYIAAFLVAILHFIMMRYLDGKPTNDKGYLEQQYATSLSLLLVALFKVCLAGSLAIAFTQHMWNILRCRALHVSSIESLHGVRYNPFLLVKWRVFYATPLLYLMAAVIWLLAVVILFPPSALTIIMESFETQEPKLVPIFDPSTGRSVEMSSPTQGVGSSSLGAWNLQFTGMIPEYTIPEGQFRDDEYPWGSYMSYLYPSAKLLHVTHAVLVAGAVPETRSPCGANCTYNVDFYGPTFQCNTTIRNETMKGLASTGAGMPNTYMPYYTGRWMIPDGAETFDTPFEMNLTEYLGYARDGTNKNGTIYQTLMQKTRLQCQPAWAHYDVQFQYHNGLRTIKSDIKEAAELEDTAIGLVPHAKQWDPTSPDVVWDADSIQNLKCINTYAVLDTIVTSLAGGHQQLPTEDLNNTFTHVLENGTSLEMTRFKRLFSTAMQEGPSTADRRSIIRPENGTMVVDSAFNVNRDNATSSDPSFAISDAILNEIVANVTIASMLTMFPLSEWNTTTTANITTYRNVYSFSRPINLILPYSLSLLFSFPFLIVGYISLRRNGVAALSDSFLQLLTTMTRGEELDRVTRPCSLGGDECATKELKQMKIMFGELVDHEAVGTGARRMGFGVEGEIVPVLKRRKV